MDTCTLAFADRVVLRSEDGPPEAEYALFDPSEIELRATSPGAIREVGYTTTASQATARLAALGVTPDLAEQAAAAMTGLISTYACGDVVRGAASVLGAAEMFESRAYRARAYEGVWLDLATLAQDLSLPGAAVGLQLVGLVAALVELDDEVRVVLRTAPYTETRRAGERTFRRVDVDAALQLPERLRALAPRARPAGRQRRTGPTRVELLDSIRGQAAAAREGARGRLGSLERAIAGTTERRPPTQGPLSDPLLWAIESSLSDGSYEAALHKIGDVEQQRGTSPPIAYLRSRASLMMGSEPPHVVAERASMLVAKVPFAELELLAAQAWAAAGNMGRALPYARVLTMDPTADTVVRGQARAIVEAAAQGVRLLPLTAPPARPFAAPPPGSGAPAQRRSAPSSGGLDHGWSSPPTPRGSARPRVSSQPSAPPTPRVSAQPSAPPMPRGETPLPFVLDPANSVRPHADTRPPATKPPLAPSPASDARRRRTPAFGERVAPSTRPPPAARSWPRSLMHGASLPGIELAVPVDTVGETAEDLTPPDVSGLSEPSADARTQFTDLTRLLGHHYRTERGVVLRMDADSIEILQAALHVSHAKGVTTTAAAADVRRHGAFLSEVLARRLGARWADVTSPDLSLWVMEIAGVATVRPFGRVLRFLERHATERDLVSFYLELWSLAQGPTVRP